MATRPSESFDEAQKGLDIGLVPSKRAPASDTGPAVASALGSGYGKCGPDRSAFGRGARRADDRRLVRASRSAPGVGRDSEKTAFARRARARRPLSVPP